MKKYYLSIILVVVVVVVTLLTNYFLRSKIVYVRVGEVVTKYEGMLEAKNAYKKKMSAWQANVDTLELDYQKSVSKYNLESSKMSATQKKEQEANLNKQKENIQRYVASLEQKASEEDQKMTKAVINQINSAIEEYGKAKGYDYILGTTNDGNILYGKKSTDITEEILKYINEQYKSK